MITFADLTIMSLFPTNHSILNMTPAPTQKFHIIKYNNFKVTAMRANRKLTKIIIMMITIMRGRKMKILRMIMIITIVRVKKNEDIEDDNDDNNSESEKK